MPPYSYPHTIDNGAGERLVFLRRPKTSTFDAPLPPFEFSESLQLWVVPFDLERGCLAGNIVPALNACDCRDASPLGG